MADRGADKHLSPDELEAAWRFRRRKAFEFLATNGGTLGILYLMQRGAGSHGPNALLGFLAIIFWTSGCITLPTMFLILGSFLSGSVRTGFHVVLCALFVFGFSIAAHLRQCERQGRRRRARVHLNRVHGIPE